MKVPDKRTRTTPWYRREDTYLQLVLLMITLGVIYIFITQEMKGWQGVWVLTNVVAGYIILNNTRTRIKVRSIWRGVLSLKVWGYAIFNLLLIAITVGVISIFLYTGSGPGGGEGNPFVSNILLVIVLFPIIPLFADAETYIFQAFLIGIFLKGEFRNCPKCQKIGPPGVPCAQCGIDNDGPKLKGPLTLLAITVSSLVFAGAHMLLLDSFVPIILIIGGMILGWTYLNKGHLFTARVHLVYNLILICGLFAVYLIRDLGVMI